MGGNISNIADNELKDIKNTKINMLNELNNLTENIEISHNKYFLKEHEYKEKIIKLQENNIKLTKQLENLMSKHTNIFKKEEIKLILQEKNHIVENNVEFKKKEIYIKNTDIEEHIKNIICSQDNNTWIPDEIEEEICRKVFEYFFNLQDK